MKRWTFRLLRSVALALVLPAFASAAERAPQPDPAATAPRTEYVIGPGDSLDVFVWRNQDLSTRVPVRPDGKISTPLVEDMVAVGKSPSALSRDIEKVLAEFVRSPQVNVIVTSPAGLLSQVKAVGQVENPQAVSFRAGMRVLDLVLAAGGLTDYAAGNRAKLVRTENGKSTDMRVKLDRLINKGDMTQNLLLQPGDVLVVPETRL